MLENARLKSLYDEHYGLEYKTNDDLKKEVKKLKLGNSSGKKNKVEPKKKDKK